MTRRKQRIAVMAIAIVVVAGLLGAGLYLFSRPPALPWAVSGVPEDARASGRGGSHRGRVFAGRQHSVGRGQAWLASTRALSPLLRCPDPRRRAKGLRRRRCR